MKEVIADLVMNDERTDAFYFVFLTRVSDFFLNT